ncbi:alkaline phosphatase family protein [Aquipuribacter sp. MA13-6]|uniref:alkaline phosphatase family protein n=1 Tax=unclassified Aquipuribacter TaxID=2635084 RepID=UPI003EEE8D18
MTSPDPGQRVQVGGAGGPALPDYSAGSLAQLLPSVAGAIGVPGYTDSLGLGEQNRVCTVLVDGLGARLLAERGGHAPFLRRAGGSQPDGVPAELRTAVPSTTATALTTLGTGRAPGAHGVIGYRAFEPGTLRVVNHLTWPADLDPEAWQPCATVFEQVAAAGVPTTMVGPAAFEGSGLTRAALRGPAYVRAESLEARVEAAAAALAASPRALVNVYWGDVDKTGHAKGWLSHEWAMELERVDEAMQALRRRAPRDALVLLTADHGMVDCPPAAVFDVADHPQLRTDVLATAGEPRLVQLRVRNGSAEDVASRWRAVLGDRAWVLTSDEAVAAGWFGATSADAATGADGGAMRRVGEVLVAARGDLAVVDSERDDRAALSMVGQHGSLTDDETAVPLLRLHG